MAADQANDDAPTRSRREDKDGDLAIVGRSVTINRPRHKLFAYWRDCTHLPTFMHVTENIRTTDDNLSIWTVNLPTAQTRTLETEVIAEDENETIGWHSVAGSQIETARMVSFVNTPIAARS